MAPSTCKMRFLKNSFQFGQDIWLLNICALPECALKLFPRVGSASGGICSAYAQPTMKFVLRMPSLFSIIVLKWVAISPYAEHARKWLLVGWACAKIYYLLAERTQKLFLRTTCIFSVFPLFPMSPMPLSPSPVPFWRPVSPISRLCTLSLVLCPLSYLSVPCFLSLVLRLCSLSPILCTLSRVSLPKIEYWPRSCKIWFKTKKMQNYLLLVYLSKNTRLFSAQLTLYILWLWFLHIYIKAIG
jgi:hypothetical protein